MNRQIAIVDDLEEGHGLAALLEKEADVSVYHPRDVTIDIVQDSSLVLVDYKLSDWDERDESESIGLQPLDGVALATNFRRHLVSLQQSPPVVFALLTSHISDIVSPFPHVNRNHQIARLNNLEWVFEKRHNQAELAEQILGLASVADHLPESWGDPNTIISDGEIKKLFGLSDDQPFFNRYLNDVRSCRPPLYEMSEWSHGLAFVRWILHRVLPYPCFLIDYRELGRRLRVQPQDILAELESKSDLSQTLEAIEYRGLLCDFVGRRWWRSGLEQFLWDNTDGNSGDKNAVGKLIEAMSNDLTCVDIVFPAPCLDENYTVTDDLIESDRMVRILPDDWPSYAEQPYTTIERANETPSLRSVVIAKDRTKLDQHDA